MFPNKQAESFLINKISETTGSAVSSLIFKSIGGGSIINHTFRITTGNQQSFFLKVNNDHGFPGLFEKEKNGLEFLAKHNSIKTPPVIFCDKFSGDQFLLLKWIDSGIWTEYFWKQFGENLARLHQCSNDQFGLAEDNYMGVLPQQNNFTHKWNEFFINHRLQPQIELALQKNLLSKKHVDLFQKLFNKLDGIFNEEKPALLHGDLWSGNFMCNENSEPVLIDPAVYFGHRSMDLAMTTLFGGFDKAFYSSYQYYFPFPDNYQEQWDVCNLYPLLIHLNLFGESYLYDIINTLKKFD